MAIIPPSWAVTEFNNPTTLHTRRCDIFESDRETPWLLDAPMVDGQVSVDYSRDDKRNFDVTLHNDDGILDHDPNGFWYDKILKVFSGVVRRTDNLAWETQVGEFLIERISEPHFPDIVKVTARDFKKKMEATKFTVATGFTSGSTVKSVIASISGVAGIGSEYRNLDDDGSTLGRDFVFERGVTRWDACLEIATSYNLELFFDAQGILVLQPFTDPATSPIEFVFQTGPVGNIVNFEKTVNDSRIYNHIFVEGGSTETVIVYGEAINNLAGSPTAVDNIGDRLYQYVSSFINTTQQAQDVADSFLKVHALEEFEANLGSLRIPWLEAGDIVQFVDPSPYPNQPDRFLLSSFNIPMKLGAMSSTVKRVTQVD